MVKSPSANPSHLIYGAGRWGSWLARRLHILGESVPFLLSSSSEGRQLGDQLGAELLQELPEDLSSVIVWLCVPDDIIPALAMQHSEQLNAALAVVHCSGTVPMLTNFQRTGVMWPVQSITRTIEPDWQQMPMVVQSNVAAFAKTLHALAGNISALPPKVVNSDRQRQLLHLGATITQNFGNLLWTLVDGLLAQEDLDYRLLFPLNRNHLAKLETKRPIELQTGPAIRVDQTTIARHVELLQTSPELAQLYIELTTLIQKLARQAKPQS